MFLKFTLSPRDIFESPECISPYPYVLALSQPDANVLGIFPIRMIHTHIKRKSYQFIQLFPAKMDFIESSVRPSSGLYFNLSVISMNHNVQLYGACFAEI